MKMVPSHTPLLHSYSLSPKALALLVATLWLVLFCALPQQAGAGQQLSPQGELQLPKLPVQRGKEGYFKRQLRENQSYPHLDMAYRKERKGDLAGALAELDNYLKVDPLDDNIRLQKVVLLNKLKETAQAQTVLDAIIQNHPDVPALYVFRAELLRRLGQADLAQADQHKALSLPGLDDFWKARINLGMADAALRQKDYAKALDAAADAEALDPSYRAAMTKGLALSGLDRRKQALEAFLEAQKRAQGKTQQAETLAAAAEEAFALKNYAQARDFLLQRRELLGPDSASSARLANLSVLLGDRNAAISYFQDALREGDADARESLVSVLVDAGRLDQARALAREAAEKARSPRERAQAFVTLGVIEERLGGPENLEAAANAFAQAADIQPSAQTLLSLGRVRSKLGQTQAALQAYNKSLELAPLPDTFYELAMLLAKEKDVKQAERLLLQAQKHGLDKARLATGWKQVGLSAQAAGQPELAEKALNLARQEAPEDTALALARADVALDQKDYSLAAQRYTTLLQMEQNRSSDERRKLLLKVAASWELAGAPAKAIAAYKKILKMPDLSLLHRAETLAAVSYLYQKEGRLKDAAWALLKVAETKELPAARRSAAYQGAANFYLALRDRHMAKIVFQKALATGVAPGPKRAKILEELAQIEMRQHPEAAEKLLRQALAQPGLPNAARGRIHAGLGQLALQEKRFAAAEKEFRQSMALGNRSNGIVLALGNALYNQNKLAEAKKLFSSVLGIAPGMQAELALSNVYGKTEQPGLALYFLGQAQNAFDTLDAKELRTVCRQYGYYLEQLYQFDAALAWYTKSLNLGYDAEVAFDIARVLLKLNRPDEAVAFIEKITPDALDAEFQARLPLLKARIRLAQNKNREALDYYAEAIAAAGEGTSPDTARAKADLWYETGGVYEKLDDHTLAARAYAQAVALHPTPAYMVAQGYQELAQKNLKDARRLLAETVAKEPDYLDAHQDLAYISMQLCDNQDAIEQFMTAIDLAPLHRATTETETEELIRDVHRMRGEVRALQNQFEADLYLTYTAGDAMGYDLSPGTAQDITRRDSGLELAWIPPKFGFRDHRIFRFIARLNWVFKPKTLQPDQDSLTAALGVRYKPFKRYNVNFGLEKLFGIGDNDLSQTVFRAMGSLADGDDVNPVRTFWNYSFLFSEFDVYLEEVQRAMLYAEGRQGFAWKARDDLIVTPFIVSDVRLWSPSDADDMSLYEDGVGASIRFLFDEDKYSLSRRWVELLVTYKYGWMFHADSTEDSGTTNALFATLSFHF